MKQRNYLRVIKHARRAAMVLHDSAVFTINIDIDIVVKVASRVLKIPTSLIYTSETSSNLVPNTSASVASASSDLNGMAVVV